MDSKTLLLPKTTLGKVSTIYFCIVWWILVNKPVLGILNNMVSKEGIRWVLGMPINFFYVLVIAVITVALTFIVLEKWNVGGED